MQRSAFSRQPARFLLVDLHPSLDVDTSDALQEVLEHFFSLVCSLSGPFRVPFFGLIGFASYPEVLFPLQNVKGNFTRLLSAVRELPRLQREVSHTLHQEPGRIADVVQEAVTIFRRQAQSLLQTAGFWSQLEITLLTCQSAASIGRQVEKVTKELNLDNLRKIQVVGLNNPDQLCLSGDQFRSSQNSGISEPSSTSSAELGGLVDCITIDNDTLSLENFFKGWLPDTGTDREHLHLLLPGDKGEPLTLRCDLQDRMLNPAQLSFSSCFSLSVGTQPGKTVQPLGKASGIQITIPQLRVINRIPLDAICESVLYGMPQIVRSTSCWKIDWDELEVNQKHFHALCTALHQQNESLLACMEDGNKQPVKKRGALYNPPKPSGHFLLLPSHNGTMLIKSIAVSELLLPSDVTAVSNTSEESQRMIQESIAQLNILNSYNPLLTSCGLYDSLTYQLTNGARGGTSQMKTKPPTKMQGEGLSAGVRKRAIGRGEREQSFVGNQGYLRHSGMDTREGEPTKRGRKLSGKDYYSGSVGEFPTEL